MVIELQVASPIVNSGISRKVYPDADAVTSHYRDQLSSIKTSLLNPAEVTFLNVHDECNNRESRRKRLTTISSDASDTESFGSSSSSHPNKKKIPDGGYGWVKFMKMLNRTRT